MNYPDLINGTFEFVGGLAVLRNIFALRRDKELRGFSIESCLFFTAWGYYNCGYYPHLNLWWSFTGGMFIALANTAWLILYAWYKYTKQLS